MNKVYSLLHLVNHLDITDSKIATLLTEREDIYREILRITGLFDTNGITLSSFQTRCVREIASLVREDNLHKPITTRMQEPTELW